ncbi:hypothetical protein BKA67DRAFT_501526, partial [Truncatella angustata]
KEQLPVRDWKYDAFVWLMSVTIDLFYREVSYKGICHIPKTRPTIFIAAPHHNQFVDGLILQRAVRLEGGRRISLLVSKNSLESRAGWGVRQTGAIPVARPQDLAKTAKGTIYLPDPINEPTTIRGLGTDFRAEAEIGGAIFLPSGASAEIDKIMGPEEIRIKRPLNRTSLSQPMSKFRLSPYSDRNQLYQAVFDRLKNGGCIGIFPEGGSHDRTEMLPLKAGVAIMALDTLSQAPHCGLTIVPVGMNYFRAHKFRSRAVVEFGAPFEVPTELVTMYQSNGDSRKEAISRVLTSCKMALDNVIVTSPSRETLGCVRTASRLLRTGKERLPLSQVVELIRKVSRAFSKSRDDPNVINLLVGIRDYNKQLRSLRIKDHHVESASWRPLPEIAWQLMIRLVAISILFAIALPGLILFTPVLIMAKYISIQRAKAALARSSVKLTGRDVMATWKGIVALGLSPICYHLYCCVLAYNRAWGYVHVPDSLPWYAIYIMGWIIFPAISLVALWLGETGMDIAKSLRPLILCLSPPLNQRVQRLRLRRIELALEIERAILKMG